MKTKEAVRSSERYICLRALGYLGCKWYLMDLEKINKLRKKKNSSSGEECIDRPFFPIPLCGFSACAASTGTGFYFIGGDTENFVDEDRDADLVGGALAYIPNVCDVYERGEGSKLFYGSCTAMKFDATEPKKGFVEAPQMTHKRVSPAIAGKHQRASPPIAMAFKGKIYIFSRCPVQKDCLGECFNPEFQEWTCIPYPPQVDDIYLPQFGDNTTIAIPFDENHLLLGPFADDDGGKVSYWLYNIEDKSWTKWPNPFPLLNDCKYSVPVMVGDTLYYRLGGGYPYDYGEICAFDLQSGLHYTGVIGQIEGGGEIDSKLCISDSDLTTLFHLGGDDFCFFTVLSDRSWPSTSSICCTKVRVVKRDDGQTLNVTLVSTLSIPADDYVFRIIDTTPVDEIFVKTLRPNTKKAGGSGVLTHVGKWVLGIGVVVLLSMVGTRISGRVDRSGSKQRVAPRADEGLNLDK